MTVLMYYHNLVERDSTQISSAWKFIIVALLFIIVGASFVTTFSFHSLLMSFNEHCVLYARIRFTMDDNNETKISEIDSTWSSPTLCDYSIFFPLFVAFVAIIWMSMFLMCGVGGKGEQSILPSPWRIVVPALIFFLIMSLITFSFSVFVAGGFDTFCAELLENSIYDSFSCAQLMKKFEMSSSATNITADENYYLILSFPWILLGCWTTAFFVMILRWLFVVDFKLVRVIISTQQRATLLIQEDDKEEDDRENKGETSAKHMTAPLKQKKSVTIIDSMQYEHLAEESSDSIALPDNKTNAQGQNNSDTD